MPLGSELEELMDSPHACSRGIIVLFSFIIPQFPFDSIE